MSRPLVAQTLRCPYPLVMTELVGETDRIGWPSEFPLHDDGTVAEGIVVWSQSHTIEGRTTGSRRRCTTTTCPGWFIGVRWETGQMLFPCSEGWKYTAETNEVAITGGGEISARFVAPEPLGTPPLPKEQWPSRSQLTGLGWRHSDQHPSL